MRSGGIGLVEITCRRSCSLRKITPDLVTPVEALGKRLPVEETHRAGARELPMTPPSFTPKSLSFLRSLKRNNDREWFRARKDDYERHVRAPMVAVIERLAVDFGRFAPELDASPKRCIYRIYRDTRFSGDKTPLKTQIAASFRWRRTAARAECRSVFRSTSPMGVDGRRVLRAGDRRPGAHPSAHLGHAP